MKVLLTFIVLVAVACGNKKNQSGEASEKQTMGYEEKGYQKATIVYESTAQEPCDYLIQGEDRLMEPLAIERSLKQADLEVWIKYVPQRRQGRCGDALPIEIEDIKKRED